MSPVFPHVISFFAVFAYELFSDLCELGPSVVEGLCVKFFSVSPPCSLCPIFKRAYVRNMRRIGIRRNAARS